MKLGLNSYSMNKAIQAGEMTIQDVVRWTADHGGEHLEIYQNHLKLTDDPQLPEKIRALAERAGIRISGYMAGGQFLQPDREAFEAEIARVCKEVDTANLLGVKRMRHDVATRPVADAGYVNFKHDLPKLTEACQRIADYAARFGITTSVENHGHFIQGSERLQALVDAVNRNNFRATLDSGNFLYADEDPAAAIRKTLPIASMIHLKDCYRRPADRDPGEGWSRSAGGYYIRGAIVGHGDLDIRAVLRAIKFSGYDGDLSVEFEGKESGDYGSRISMDNVRSIWGWL